MSFDWQTEEDVAWDEEIATNISQIKRGWPWRTLLLFLGLVGAATGWGYWQVNQRVVEATARVTQDILSSHRLIQQTAVNQDSDLFFTLLSGRDPAWADLQEGLVTDGHFFDRQPFGLKAHAPTLERADDPVVTVSADLNEAEVVTSHAYTVTLPNGRLQTAYFEQTYIYRRGNQKWLLSPPLPAFWGENETFSGEWVEIIYPLHDEGIVTRLAPDLDGAVEQLCRTDGLIACEADRPLRLQLVPETAMLADGSKTLYTLDDEEERRVLRLPTPNLIGVPLDDAAYEAMLRGYSGHLLSAIIADSVDFDCCDQIAIQRALIDYELSRLGIQWWPVASVTHVATLTAKRNLDDLIGLWREDEIEDISDEAWQNVYTAVDFLINEFPDVEITMMLQTLAASRSFASWLRTLYPAYAFDGLNEAWWAYAARLSVSETPPTPLPQQDLHLICATDGPFSSEMTLYQYGFDTTVWTENIRVPGLTLMTPFGNDEGLFLQKAGDDDGAAWELRVWQKGRSRLLWQDDAFALTFGQTDPNGRYGVAYGGFAVSDIQPQRFELEVCDEGACVLDELMGLPVWSPNGTHTLVSDVQFIAETPSIIDGRIYFFDQTGTVEPHTLYLADARAENRVEVGVGYAPFWLDETTYAYIRIDDDTIPLSDQMRRDLFKQEVVVATIDNPEPIPLFDTADLGLTFVEEDEDVSPNMVMHYVMAHPSWPNLFFVVASDLDNLDGSLFVFAFDRATGEITQQFQAARRLTNALGFSPDGRWLVTLDSGVSGSRITSASILLHDVAQNKTRFLAAAQPFFAPVHLYDWSSDSQWMAYIFDEETILLTAPAYDNYTQILRHDFGSCTSLAWINREVGS